MTQGAGPGMAPTLTGADLVRAVPQLAHIADLEVVSFAQKPGASLTLEDLLGLAHLLNEQLAQGFAGAVVVQGTDTIEETAFVLDLLVASDRPVVVTGAMRGAAAPGADGPANLMSAVTVAVAPDIVGLGALVVLNDEVHAARHVQKMHTALASAFASPGFAPLARVIEGRVRLYARVPGRILIAVPVSAGDSPVALLTVVLGDDGRLLQALPGLGYRGVVIEALGAGHLPSLMADRVAELSQSMPVILATRVAAGPVFTSTYGFAGSELDLIGKGAVPSGELSGPKACLLLRLLLAQGLQGATLVQAFARVRDGGV
ncbi:L-asparaginase [Polaromonas eurypsychrophila]|uniref:L-asparaginase n=2 Tax=Polaromonas eurypsychrophila TaxID=1614635 RepID=A0A916SHH1_9BURK|nr:L-asparaginase [Polaromonas eurypsychrophila]